MSPANTARIAVAQPGRVTERQWPMMVGRGCVSAGAGFEEIAERPVEAARLLPGDTALDLACGTASVAIAAARRGCVVTGVDDVHALIEPGRDGATAGGLSVTFTEADAEHLPYPDASFDAVLACVGVMFAPRHRQAAGELVRLCRPGGTIALANWTPAGFVGRIFQTLAAHVPAASLMRPPGLWGTEQHLETLLGRAVERLTLSRREYVFRFPSTRDFVDGLRDSCGP